MTVASVSAPPDVSPPADPKAAPNAAPKVETAPASPERPAWLPAEFASPEDFAASHADLKAKVESLAPKAETAPATREQMVARVATAGLDFSKYEREWAEKGGALSEASLGELEAKGITKEDIGAYARGQEALAEQARQGVLKAIGGESEFRKVQAWARLHVPPAELQAFNDAVDKLPPESLQLVVQGLHARYLAANGSEPKLVGGNPPGAPAGFQSRHELVTAMQDPRYARDEAYRDQVTRKLAATSIF